jgi:hypothetical protein
MSFANCRPFSRAIVLVGKSSRMIAPTTSFASRSRYPGTEFFRITSGL